MKQTSFALFMAAGMLALVGAGCGDDTSDETINNLNQSVPVEQNTNTDTTSDKQPGENIGEEDETSMDAEDVEDMTATEMTVDDGAAMDAMLYQYAAVLTPNLAGAATGEESGLAYATYDDDEYSLSATFENLPELDEAEYFYEGWVVAPGSVVSTGALVEEDGELVNRYKNTEDLTDHTQYVLTLEPQDGDPSPAAHVVEGEFTDN